MHDYDYVLHVGMGMWKCFRTAHAATVTPRGKRSLSTNWLKENMHVVEAEWGGRRERKRSRDWCTGGLCQNGHKRSGWPARHASSHMHVSKLPPFYGLESGSIPPALQAGAGRIVKYTPRCSV